MPKKKVILTFEWDGKTVHKDAQGFKGKECVKQTSYIEKGLGILDERKFKHEYNEGFFEGNSGHQNAQNN
jgi:hypothetical protein